MGGISVIIVNYAAADLAIDAAQSVLERAHGGRHVDVHLVDNASPGEDAARIAQAHAARGWGDRVTLYLESENHGFGRGNNLVLERLAERADPPEYVFLLNPDARLENEALAILATFLDTTPDAGIAGARIQKPGDVPVTAAFRFPSLIATFEQALAFGPVSRLAARWRVPLAPDAPTGPVDWVAGAALLARLEALKAVAFFDPAFFLYYEEVDLMRRTKAAGWQTWYVTEALVIHAEGVSTGVKSGDDTRPRRPAYWYESWLIYHRKAHGRLGALAMAVAWILGAALNHLLSALRRRPPAAPAHLFGDLWRGVIRPLLGFGGRSHG